MHPPESIELFLDPVQIPDGVFYVMRDDFPDLVFYPHQRLADLVLGAHEWSIPMILARVMLHDVYPLSYLVVFRYWWMTPSDIESTGVTIITKEEMCIFRGLRKFWNL